MSKTIAISLAAILFLIFFGGKAFLVICCFAIGIAVGVIHSKKIKNLFTLGVDFAKESKYNK
jgi:uncharacterized membrane protein